MERRDEMGPGEEEDEVVAVGGEGVLNPLADAADAAELGGRHGGRSQSWTIEQGKEGEEETQRERLERRKETKLPASHGIRVNGGGYLRNGGGEGRGASDAAHGVSRSKAWCWHATNQGVLRELKTTGR